ncbi:RES domain-containing protein [Alkalicaulis satelles]|uniref:RES domain-containing protein n=1 Tax=Alkalicaulis satelles TaxID=2609175 RepID=A0A5M6ZL32_9PROT|nr:RES domain-containing protein [Alkalicaulis satelles]
MIVPGLGLHVWRLDKAVHAPTWHSGAGSALAGGRWNSTGRRVIYASLDPATAILEVAAHKTFPVLGALPHTLTRARLKPGLSIRVADEASWPDPDWLKPGIPVPARQAFGDRVLADHHVLIAPSAVSRHSWNAVIRAGDPQELFEDIAQEAFSPDRRLSGQT